MFYFILFFSQIISSLGRLSNQWLSSLRLNPVNDSLSGSISIVVDWVGLVVSWVELEGWESSDGDGLDLVEGGINLGDDDVGVLLELLSSLLPLWGERLAVSTPGGVELDKDVLGVIEDLRLEALSDQNSDWSWVGGWDLLGLQESGEFSGVEVVDKSGDGFDGEISVVLVLGNILGGVDQHDLWDASGVDSQVLSESLEVSVSVVWVSDGEDDSSSLELLGDGLEVGLGGLRLRVLVVEQEDGWVSLLEDLLDGSVVELHDGGE